jgi:hypothetical protein
MGLLDPSRLRVTCVQDVTPGEFSLPRRHTLTHSDITGVLFLSIGRDFDRRRISRPYTRLMRDEVLSEFATDSGGFELRVFCHVSGGFVIGSARWRYSIFRSELPLALEAICFGERLLLEKHLLLNKARVTVHFESSQACFNKEEKWGIMGDYVR